MGQKLIIYLLFLFVLSVFLTGSVRSFALKNELMDIPNHRSSHAAPTPRGGGIAFVILFLCALIYLRLAQSISLPTFMSTFVGGLIVAGLGLIDDFKSFAPKWRFLGQVLAALIVILTLKTLPVIYIGPYKFALTSYVGIVGGMLFLVWMTNLYNFMDGIDGIAAIESIFACSAMVLIYWLNAHFLLIVLPLLLLVSVGGFLFWNFPVAKIFMGDVGSGFLGMTLAILSLQAAVINESYFWSWLILLGIFVVDSTVTLFFRACRGEKIYTAHKAHAYQRLAGFFNNHFSVNIALLFVNGVWLLPVALCVGLGLISGFYGLLIAYAPLCVLAYFLKAGR